MFYVSHEFVSPIKHIHIIKNVEPIIYLILSECSKNPKQFLQMHVRLFIVILIFIFIKTLVYIFILV
jgi:hypothetical protein